MWSSSTSSSRETVDVDVEYLNPRGDGVARHRRRTITIPFTIPGERVRVTVRTSREGVQFGTLQQVLVASPHRVVPHCPHFGAQGTQDDGCGGCSWQHIAYPEQLRLKSQLVARLVRRQVRGAPPARPTTAATAIESPWGYRHKIHFVFNGAPRSRLAMGHYVRGSRHVIPVVTCPVHDERGNDVAFRFRDSFARAGITAGEEPAIKSVAVRTSAATNETMATLVLAGHADRRIRAATLRVLDEDGPSSFHVNIHPRGDAYIFGPETRRISGPERMREEVAEVSFLISPTAFFQTNVRAAEVLVRVVVDEIPHPSRVLDLYAGAGLFALPLARAGDEVVAVEESGVAVADGEASRSLNAIQESQCRFIRRRVEDALPALAHQAFDVVVLDPPRVGCLPSVVATVFGKIAPRRAIYVSCDPQALAEDLRAIVPYGYDVRSLQPVDMFPHTAHVETIAVLVKGAPK